MSLTNALMIASQSLGTITSQINLVSRNIAGAGTDEITKKTAILRSGPNGASEFRGIRRETNLSIFKYLISTNSNLARTSRVSGALQQMDLSLNLSDPAESRTPASLLARFTDSVLKYSINPEDRSSAEVALQAAQDVVTSLHDNSNLVKELRRQADDNIATGVDNINDILKKISDLNHDIIKYNDTGVDNTDMMDRRDSLLRELSAIIGIKPVMQPNQDLVIYADNGSTLLETTPRNVTFQKTDNLSAGVVGAAVYIDGVRATGAGVSFPLLSGSIAGDIYVRDNLATAYQAQLDEIARGLVVAFAESDQSGAGGPPLPGLFTFPNATDIPDTVLSPGRADQIMINPTVDPGQGGNSMLLRDGGISGNSAYIYNTEAASGYSERLNELSAAEGIVLSYDPLAKIDLNGPLKSFMEASIGWIGSQQQNISRDLTYQTAILSQSKITFSNSTGINIDEQMSLMISLENAFQASAKLMQTINSVYDSLFSAIGR